MWRYAGGERKRQEAVRTLMDIFMANLYNLSQRMMPGISFDSFSIVFLLFPVHFLCIQKDKGELSLSGDENEYYGRK
jgi:hypothetical protein